MVYMLLKLLGHSLNYACINLHWPLCQLALVPLLLRQDITPWSCFCFSFFAQIWHQFVLIYTRQCLIWTKSRRMFEFSHCKQNWHCSLFYVLYNCLFKNPNNLTLLGSSKCWARSLINLHMNLYGLIELIKRLGLFYSGHVCIRIKGFKADTLGIQLSIYVPDFCFIFKIALFFHLNACFFLVNLFQ